MHPPTHPAQQTPMAAQMGPAAIIDESVPNGSESTSTIKRPGRTRAGLLAAIAVVGGGGAFAVQNALSAADGPESPEAAVSEMFTSIDNGDFLGIADVLLPSEREAILEPSLALLEELQRLEILDEFDPAAVSSVDITVEGLEFEVDSLSESVAVVEVVGGTIETEGVDGPGPLGDLITDRVDPQDIEDFEAEADEVDFDEDPVRIAVVNDGSGWYVSYWYTAAEALREEAGEPLPFFGQGPTPLGADTPEAAVTELMDEIADLDLEGMIGHLDPEEFRALYDYSTLFVDDAQDELDGLLDEIEAEGVDYELRDVEAASSEVRGRTIVTIEAFTFELSAPGVDYRIEVSGDCSTVSVQGDDVEPVEESFCEGDPVAGQDFVELPDLEIFGALSDVETGITVVERDGGWFVAGAPTFLGMMTDYLVVLDRPMIDEAIDSVEELAEGLGEFVWGSSESEFIEVEDAISGDFESYDSDDEAYESEGYEEVDYYFDPVNYVPGFEVTAYDPGDWWWSDTVTPGTELTSLVYIFAEGEWIDVAEFVSAEEAAISFELLEFEPIDAAGLPEGARAARSASEFAVVIDNWILTGFGEVPSPVAVQQVSHLANQ